MKIVLADETQSFQKNEGNGQHAGISFLDNKGKSFSNSSVFGVIKINYNFH